MLRPPRTCQDCCYSLDSITNNCQDPAWCQEPGLLSSCGDLAGRNVCSPGSALNCLKCRVLNVALLQCLTLKLKRRCGVSAEVYPTLISEKGNAHPFVNFAILLAVFEFPGLFSLSSLLRNEGKYGPLPKGKTGLWITRAKGGDVKIL